LDSVPEAQKQQSQGQKQEPELRLALHQQPDSGQLMQLEHSTEHMFVQLQLELVRRNLQVSAEENRQQSDSDQPS
jgi:hypothetical protein